VSGPKDISDRVGKMAPDSGVLYKARPTHGVDSDPYSYIGVIRVTKEGTYWARIWPRIVNGKTVVELRLTAKSDRQIDPNNRPF
jgi:hypothetical protein